MKKDSFEKGAFVATLCIFITKFLGVLYVIPFYMIITTKGAALYSYAYNVYAIFLSISTAGIPLALSKLTSEFDAKKMYDAKLRTYKVSMRLIFTISIVTFLILMIFTPQFAHLIIGDVTGGNTIEDIVLVIRAVAFALLVLPFVSIDRGFLQGNKYISPSSISQVVEQIVRIIFLLGGSYLILKVLDLSETAAIMIAISGATIGGIGAFIYLEYIFGKHKDDIFKTPTKEDKITNKEIAKKIISYAIPFVIVNVALTVYNFVDIVLIYRTLTGALHLSAVDTEAIISVYSTWTEKFQRIVISVSTGVAVSLIPNIVKHYTMKDKEGVKKTFNKAIQIVTFLALPLTILISIFAKDVWYVFYGKNEIGSIVLTFNIYIAFLSAISVTLTSALQGLSKYKIVYLSVILGIVINAALDVPLILLMNKFNIYPYYGAILSSIIGFSISNLIALKLAKKECDIDYKPTYKMLLKLALSVVLLIGSALILKSFVTYNYTNRFIGLVMTSIYFVIPLGIYLLINYKNGMIKELLKDRKS